MLIVSGIVIARVVYNKNSSDGKSKGCNTAVGQKFAAQAVNEYEFCNALGPLFPRRLRAQALRREYCSSLKIPSEMVPSFWIASP